ncbi:hypothetical protein BDR03DRAFT_84931 [Suillus americanus]|nr:hypothetical protein BDR03DRAFT_84931 [Suillus americanus]
MSNRRTPADVDSAIPSSGSSEQLQDNHPRTQAHSLSSSSAASFHQSTSAPATTGDQQWFPPSHQMIVTSSSFYDPTQASGFTAQQPTMNVWDTQFTGPGGDYFPRQHTTYQQPYRFEGAATNQYSFAQDQVQRQQHSQPRSAVPAARRSARGSARPSGYYRQGGAQSQQYSQVPPSVPPNPPSAQPPPQPSQQPTGQALAAQRTTQLIAGQFSPVQAEQQYPAQQPQPHFSPPPPPTQSQFQIQQPQFPPTPQFSQSQPQPRPQSQFSQPHHPHVPTQSHAHSHVSTHAQSQPQVHTPPNPPQQSQHYSGPSDSYYLQGDMYYAMNTQGSRSAPSLVSDFLLVLVLNFFGWRRTRTPPMSCSFFGARVVVPSLIVMG